MRRDGAELVLELELPFTDRDELEVGRTGHELLVRVGPYRRGIVLPDALRRRRVSGAALRDGCLAVRFADPAGPAGDGDRAGAGPARGEGRPPTGAPSAGVPATGASSG